MSEKNKKKDKDYADFRKKMKEAIEKEIAERKRNKELMRYLDELGA